MNASLFVILLSAITSFVGKPSEVFLSLKYKGGLVVYEGFDRAKAKMTIKHNIKDEDYVLVTIKDSRDDMYNVDVSFAIAGNKTNGWIKKTSSLAVFAKAYVDGISLYKNADRKSGKTKVSYISKELQVLDFHDGWLKVSVNVQGELIIGWLPASYQCANPYTSCG